MTPLPSTHEHLLAIEIGGSKLQLFAGTGEGHILESRRFTVDREAGREGICKQIESALPELLAKWRPRAIGVGYGGPVDWRTGRIARSYHISGWSQFPLGEWLADLSGVPVFVENDANTAALAEATHGAGVGANPVLWVNSGSGVGGGLVINGDIYHGKGPTEMEIGHLRLERDGTIVEDRCSGWSLDRRVREVVAAHPDSPLAKRVAAEPGGPETRHLSPALAAGDPQATHILDEAMRELAFALSHAVQLLNPEVIVVGGGVALLGEPVRSRLAEHLPGFLMDTLRPGPRVVLSPLMETAVPVGALTIASRRLAV